MGGAADATPVRQDRMAGQNRVYFQGLLARWQPRDRGWAETFTCTATDAPASFTTGTDPDDMFQDPMPPEHLFNRPGLQTPYPLKGRLLIAAYEVEEHVLQFWPA